MAEMTVIQLTEYLKQAASLETSVYKQTKTRENANNSLVKRTVRCYTPNPPEPATKGLYQPTKEPLADVSGIKKASGIFYFFGIICIAVPVFMLIGWADPSVGVGIASLVAGVAILWVLNALCRSAERANEEKEARYKTAMKAYEKKKAEAEEEYRKKYGEYLDQKEEAEEKYQEEARKADLAYIKAAEQVKQLDAPLSETKALLEKLYSADIIFPKYRNMVAMCTMYEYFASGRCTELTGANGAYNLYESELRQNIIINQLENVNANLEQVKQNQYILYQGIAETNQTLRDISADVKNIVNATYDIAVSSRITAYCSQITAANAQAQTYLALMD